MKITANVVPMNILPNLEMKNTRITYVDTNSPAGTKYTFKNIYPSQMLPIFSTGDAILSGQLIGQKGADTTYTDITIPLSMSHVRDSNGTKIVDFGGDITSYILVGRKSYPAKGEIILTGKPQTSILTIQTTQ